MPTPFKHPKTGVYYFRRAIPADLWTKLGKRELKATLGTKDPAEAKRLFVAKLAWSDDLFEQARSPSFTLPDREALRLAGEWLGRKLAEDDQQRAAGDVPDQWVPDDEALISSHEADLDSLQLAEFHGRQLEAVRPELEELIRENSFPVQADDPALAPLVRRLFDAKVTLLQTQDRRAHGDYSPVAGLLKAYPKAPVAALGSPARGVTKGDALSTVFDAFKAERELAPKSVQEYAKAVRRFIELHGDVPAISITRAMAREYKDALRRLPAVLTHQQRGTSLPKLLASLAGQPEARTLSVGAINKDLTALSSVMSWAGKNGYFDALATWANPFTGVKVEPPKNREKDRFPYEVDDLNAIFSSPIYTQGSRPLGGGGEAAFWLPLLGLFTGGRENELGQLVASDVAQDGGVWCIRVNKLDEHKRVKNVGSHRKVPLHPELIRLGFLTYAETRRSRDGDGALLFPALKPDRHGYTTGNWSKWWGRYARKVIGITDRKKVFHSFRHAFEDGLREAGVTLECVNAIQGHKTGGMWDVYGKGYSVQALAREMEKLKYPGLDLSAVVAP